ncbi:uncharacterized protein C2845_PM06G11040 [Panicum miliaceum]|uniref:Ribosome biogenesis protein slx9-like n=1 Tax=Panicum miliaceum TaxID=4540 RepID=A0A3L6RDM0_PANMI|nr:uncharacterized protein C2845_PM06G11040 [Panicum miliaceum]
MQLIRVNRRLCATTTGYAVHETGLAKHHFQLSDYMHNWPLPQLPTAAGAVSGAQQEPRRGNGRHSEACSAPAKKLGELRLCPWLRKKNQSRRQKKLKAYDLSALSEFLPEPAEPEHKTETKLNCKSRQTLVLRESAHLKAVLNNPQFQLDPFAAIHQHLLATQPPEAARKDDAAKHGKDSKDKKRRRKKKSTSSSTQAMDI